MNDDSRTIEHGAGGAHPRAQHSAVGGRLMVCMVTGVLDGLRLSQPADGQDAENEEDRENSYHGAHYRQ